MKTIILSAGQGKRLSPLTDNSPKCLLEVLPNLSILEWQILQLDAACIAECIVVTGFKADQVEESLAAFKTAYQPKINIRTKYNPFYKVADNIGSVFLCCDDMDDDFMILNGDTLLTQQIVSNLKGHDGAPITLTIAKKDQYDSDDMKVSLDGDKLKRVGKTLQEDSVGGESIGFMKFSGAGVTHFKNTVEQILQDQQNLKRWYLSILDEIAINTDMIDTVEAPQSDWCEVDFPVDHKQAREKVKKWAKNSDFTAQQNAKNTISC